MKLLEYDGEGYFAPQLVDIDATIMSENVYFKDCETVVNLYTNYDSCNFILIGYRKLDGERDENNWTLY